MNKHRLIAPWLLAAAAALASPAWAENHALIMTIDYAGTNVNELFPSGLEADGRMASQMAESMGVPRQNIRWLRNKQLTLQGMTDALVDLAKHRVREGDKVFLFYSGHGAQDADPSGGSKCKEALVASDGKFVLDDELQLVLEVLASKASQVVMFNNSCFSGGQATKSATPAGGLQPMFARVGKAGSAADAGYTCSNAVNAKALSRSLGVVASAKSTRMLYVASAADNEVAWMSRKGGLATLAWARCLQGGAADRDRNGIVDGEELRQCAQAQIDGGDATQTVTLVGASKLPLSFVGSSGGGSSAPVTNAAGALESLRAAADPSIRVDLRVANPTLKIGRDMLDFSVTLDRPGHLYLLHLGTDGNYHLLFPNQRDSANRLPAGTHRFPRADWALQAQGPAGKGYFMAYWSAAPHDFTKALSKDGLFASAKPTTASVRSLGVVATQQRFGASAVVQINEVP